MKLVFAKEMQSLDQQSAEQIGLPTMVLMENAGKAVAETAADESDKSDSDKPVRPRRPRGRPPKKASPTES